MHPSTTRWALIAAGLVLGLLGCEPIIERDNPADPQGRSPAPARVTGTIEPEGITPAELVERGPVTIRLRRIDGAGGEADTVDAAEIDGFAITQPRHFDLDLPHGVWSLTITGRGYAASPIRLELGPARHEELGAVPLDDIADPAPPTLHLPAAVLADGLPVVADPTLPVCLGHEESGVSFSLEVGGGAVGGAELAAACLVDLDICPAFAPLRCPARLPDADGLHPIAALALDPAGRVSARALASVRLDRGRPTLEDFALWIDNRRPEPGRPLSVSAPIVQARVLALRGAAPGTTVAVRVDAVDGPAPEDCVAAPGDALRCTYGIEASAVLGLAGDRRWHCASWAVCDAAGNMSAVGVLPVHLEPHLEREPPTLTGVRVEAEGLEPQPPSARARHLARRSTAGVRLRAFGAFIDVGARLHVGEHALPCSVEVPGTHCTAASPEGCATACVAELPEAISLVAGRYPVRLEVRGPGEAADTLELIVEPPQPCVDRYDPMGVAAPMEPIRVRVWGRDLIDSTRFHLGAADGVVEALAVDPDDPDAVQATIRFDAQPWEGDPEPGSLRVSGPADACPDAVCVLAAADPRRCRDVTAVQLPFTVAPDAADCAGGCPLGRSSPATEDGRVGVVARVPAERSTVVGIGALDWQLSDRDGPVFDLGGASRRAALRLPHPVDGARFAASGSPVEGRSLWIEPGDELEALPPIAGGPPLCGVSIEPRRDPELLDAALADLDHAGSLERVAVLAFGDGRSALCVPSGGLAIDEDAGCVELELAAAADAALGVGDITGDGRPEVIVGRGEAVEVWAHAPGDGRPLTRLARLSAPPGCAVGALALTDLDGDRLPELIASAIAPGECPEPFAWTLAADGRWSAVARLAGAPQASALIHAPATRLAGPAALLVAADGVWRVTASGPLNESDRVEGGPLPIDAQRIIESGALAESAWHLLGAPDETGARLLLGGRPGESVEAWRERRDGWTAMAEALPAVNRGLALVDVDADGRPELIATDAVEPAPLVAVDLDDRRVDRLTEPTAARSAPLRLAVEPSARLRMTGVGLDGTLWRWSAETCPDDPDPPAAPDPCDEAQVDVPGFGTYDGCTVEDRPIAGARCGRLMEPATQVFAFEVDRTQVVRAALSRHPWSLAVFACDDPGALVACVEAQEVSFAAEANVRYCVRVAERVRQAFTLTLSPVCGLLDGGTMRQEARPSSGGRLEVDHPCDRHVVPGQIGWTDLDLDGRADLVAVDELGLMLGVTGADRAMTFCDADLAAAIERAHPDAAVLDEPLTYRGLAIAPAPDAARPVLCVGVSGSVVCGRPAERPCEGPFEVHYVTQMTSNPERPIREVQLLTLDGSQHVVTLHEGAVRVGPAIDEVIDEPSRAAYRTIGAPRAEVGRYPLQALHIGDFEPDPPGGARRDEMLLDGGERLKLVRFQGFADCEGEPDCLPYGDAWWSTGIDSASYDPAYAAASEQGVAIDRIYAALGSDDRWMDRVALTRDSLLVHSGEGAERIAADAAGDLVGARRVSTRALAVADLDLDGRLDLLTAGTDDSAQVGVYLDRDGLRGQLDLELTVELGGRGPSTPALFPAAPDLTGEGIPELSVSMDEVIDRDGERVHPARTVLRSPARPEATTVRVVANSDGGPAAPALPRGWYQGLRALVRTERGVGDAALTLTVTGPGGEAVVGDAIRIDDGIYAWVSGPATPVLGRQPAGHWIAELEPPIATTVELIADVRWVRPAEPR